jgi:hypothetical protein
VRRTFTRYSNSDWSALRLVIFRTSIELPCSFMTRRSSFGQLEGNLVCFAIVLAMRMLFALTLFTTTYTSDGLHVHGYYYKINLCFSVECNFLSLTVPQTSELRLQ